MKNVILWRAGVFLFIFAPVLNVGLGAYGDTLSLLCVFAIISFLYSLSFKSEVVLPEARKLSLIIFLLMVYGLLGSLFFSSKIGSFQAGIRPLRALIMFWGLYVFTIAYAKKFGNRFDAVLINDVFLAIGFHALIMIAEFILPDIRDAIYPYTFADKGDPYNQMFRMAGLTNGGGAQLSLFQSFGLLLWPLALANQQRFYEKLFSNILAICIFLSLLLSGRSGIVLVMIMLPVVFFFTNRARGLLGIIPFLSKLIIFCVVIIGILYALIPDGFMEEGNWIYAQTAIDRSFDYLTFEGKVSEYGVVDDLSGQWLLPADVKTLLVGDPYLFEASYLMEDRIVQSDIGYVYFLFGYGLIGSLLHYLFYVLILLYALRYWHVEKQLALISIIWVLAILAFQAKENFAFTRIGFSFTTMFFVALVIKRARMFERIEGVKSEHLFDFSSK